MSRPKILLILGVFISILPYLGFPYVSKNILITLSGLAVVYLSYTLYEEDNKEKNKEQVTFDNFSENHDFVENESAEEEVTTQAE